MRARPSVRIRIGDIVVIPIADGLFACAQVLEKRKIIYLAVLSKLYSQIPQLSDLNLDSVALMGWSMDAKIYHGYWKIIGNLSTISIESWKRDYLVGYGGAVWVENFDGQLMHEASKEEQQALHYRSSHSPAQLERAVRAFHGLERWDAEFDDLLTEHREGSVSE